MESDREDRSTGVYTNFVSKLLVSQEQCIPYRTIGVNYNESKGMTAWLNHYIFLNRDIYNRIKLGQRYLVNQHNTHARSVKRETREAS